MGKVCIHFELLMVIDNFYYIFAAYEVRHRFSQIQASHRIWLIECEKNRSKGEECRFFKWQDQMKFLEKSTMKCKLEGKKAKGKKVYTKGSVGRELMEQVKKHPIIFDINHPNYSNKTLTDNAWFEIASELILPGKFFK